MMSSTKQIFTLICVVALIFEPFVVCKRSGTYGRGNSPSRGSSLRSRISSAFGRNSGGSNYPRGAYGRNSGGGITGRLFGHKNRHNYGGYDRYGAGQYHRGSGGGLLGGGGRGALGRGLAGGGLLGGLSRSRHRGMGGGGGYRTSMFRNSGMGSRSSSNTFKNMIVGAAAGYLAYKAGKAIIRNVAAPMVWNNRQYYWGPQYYPTHRHHGMASRTMCRMAIDPSDPVLGQVYMPDSTRPKEIVWSCEHHEECCGYECCPRGTGGEYGEY